MPEGPELHLASLYVNRMCNGVVFAGAVTKSDVSKSPDVAFSCEAYRIAATSRGKEVKLTLTPIKSQESEGGQQQEPMEVVFRFGMSGFFRFTAEDELPKHAHLRFYTNETPRRVLSYVDARRFGSWQPHGSWQPDRGPCIMFEYDSFRQNVVSSLSDRAFDRPICEVLLNQKYFNGIGNYLRAEILFRLNIAPFVSARTVLEGLQPEDPLENREPVKNETKEKKSAKTKVKEEDSGDLLRLCHTVPLEVVSMGGKGYDPEKKDYSAFESWLQCYYVDGMTSIRDHNGRTMWFKGDPGPMAPKDSKSPNKKKRAKKEEDHDYTHKKKRVSKKSSESTSKKQIKKEAETERKTPKKSKAGKTKAEKAPEGNARRGAARPRKSSSSSSSEPTAGALRRSCRVTRQSGK